MADRKEERKASWHRTGLLQRAFGMERKIEICDIGARKMRDGFPYQALIDLGLANLTGFEPDPEAFDRLESLKGEGQRYFCAAVGKPGPATFYLHKIGSLSSVFKLRPEAAEFLDKTFWVRREIREIPMELVGLDSIEAFPKLDILKMDIQGAELDVLQHGKEALSQAMVVIPEVCFYQMYENQPMFGEIDAEMRAQGFVLHKFLHQKSVALPSSQRKRIDGKRFGSQLLDGDAVYIRSLENQDAISDEQWMILALAAESMFGSYDLVAHCLTVLAKRGRIGGGVARKYFDKVPAEWLVDEVAVETTEQADA